MNRRWVLAVLVVGIGAVIGFVALRPVPAPAPAPSSDPSPPRSRPDGRSSAGPLREPAPRVGRLEVEGRVTADGHAAVGAEVTIGRLADPSSAPSTRCGGSGSWYRVPCTGRFACGPDSVEPVSPAPDRLHADGR